MKIRQATETDVDRGNLNTSPVSNSGNSK